MSPRAGRSKTALFLMAAFALGWPAMRGRPAVADGTVSGGQEPTRPVSLSNVRGAPVAIDSAYVNIVNGPNGKVDGLNVSCVRYRNMTSQTIVRVRFRRTYFDAARRRIGFDEVDDSTPRNPNGSAKPGSVPLARAYWECTRTPNRYGLRTQGVNIEPVFVRFASGTTWRLR